MSVIPRLRMFAGPNGSGKSTIKGLIRPGLLGAYINPDDIEDELRRFGRIDTGIFGIRIAREEALRFFRAAVLIQKFSLQDQVEFARIEDGNLSFPGVEMNSYLASVIADFIRHKLLESGASFSFETVMSSPDKPEFLKTAQNKGFRTYLYYVATGSACGQWSSCGASGAPMGYRVGSQRSEEGYGIVEEELDHDDDRKTY